MKRVDELEAFDAEALSLIEILPVDSRRLEYTSSAAISRKGGFRGLSRYCSNC